MHLSPRTTSTIEVPVATVATHIDSKNISSLSLFRWSATNSLTLYLDAMKLLPALSQKK
jgi:hypothetical protein